MQSKWRLMRILFSIHPLRNPQKKFRSNVKENIENIYEMFKKRVSDGRNISMEQVETLAQGRVWSGEQALKKWSSK